MTTPAWANDHCTSPEQSKDFGPLAPHMYGMPSRLSAARSMVRSTAEEARPPVTGTTEPAGALPFFGALPIWTTSCWTWAACGMSFLILWVSLVSLALGALITIALPAGNPSDRATSLVMTASTPPMPTVPKRPTRIVIGCRPATVTAVPAGSLSCLPISKDRPRLPLSTLRQNALSLATGLAAKRRKLEGFTPSMAANLPFTLTRAASTASTARTPGSLRTLRTAWAGSVLADTATMSAGSTCRSGATFASVTAGASAAGCGATRAGAAGPSSQGRAVGDGPETEAGPGTRAEPWAGPWMPAEAAAGQLAATTSTAVKAPSAGAGSRRARRIERG